MIVKLYEIKFMEQLILYSKTSNYEEQFITILIFCKYPKQISNLAQRLKFKLNHITRSNQSSTCLDEIIDIL